MAEPKPVRIGLRPEALDGQKWTTSDETGRFDEDRHVLGAPVEDAGSARMARLRQLLRAKGLGFSDKMHNNALRKGTSVPISRALEDYALTEKARHIPLRVRQDFVTLGNLDGMSVDPLPSEVVGLQAHAKQSVAAFLEGYNRGYVSREQMEAVLLHHIKYATVAGGSPDLRLVDAPGAPSSRPFQRFSNQVETAMRSAFYLGATAISRDGTAKTRMFNEALDGLATVLASLPQAPSKTEQQAEKDRNKQNQQGQKEQDQQSGGASKETVHERLDQEQQRTQEALKEAVKEIQKTPSKRSSVIEKMQEHWGLMRIAHPTRTRSVVPPRFGRVFTPSEEGSVPAYMHNYGMLGARRIFGVRHVRRGGTILIDGSGSMGWQSAELYEIFRLAPGLVVAVYGGIPLSISRSGQIGNSYPMDDGDILTPGEARLYIVSKGGRMVPEDWSSSYLGHNNLCDGPALRWLSKQAQPRVWLSDGAVNGITGMGTSRLMIECEMLVRRGGIKHVLTADAARTYFKSFYHNQLKRA